MQNPKKTIFSPHFHSGAKCQSNLSWGEPPGGGRLASVFLAAPDWDFRLWGGGHRNHFFRPSPFPPIPAQPVVRFPAEHARQMGRSRRPPPVRLSACSSRCPSLPAHDPSETSPAASPAKKKKPTEVLGFCACLWHSVPVMGQKGDGRILKIGGS